MYQAHDQAVATVNPRPLPGKWRDLLRDGQWRERYDTRAAAQLALLAAMGNAGWSWPQAHADLTDPRNAASLWFPTHAVLARLWAKSQEFLADAPAVRSAPEARHEIGQLRALLAGEVWTGRTSVTDRAVLEFVHALATARGRLVVVLACRSVGEGVGIGFKTAARALGRLVDRGWLRVEEKGEWDRAGTYRLTSPRGQCTGDTPSSPRSAPKVHVSPVHTPPGTDTPLYDLTAHDVFRCLGKSAAALYGALAPTGAVSPAALQAITGLARRTVYKHLAVLQAEGLVHRTVDGYLRVEADLDALARDMGVAGSAEAQRASYDRQRRSWNRATEGTRRRVREFARRPARDHRPHLRAVPGREAGSGRARARRRAGARAAA